MERVFPRNNGCKEETLEKKKERSHTLKGGIKKIREQDRDKKSAPAETQSGPPVFRRAAHDGATV